MGKRLKKVELTAQEESALETLISKGKVSVRQLKRAQVLLYLHRGQLAEVIAQTVGVSLATVYNIHGRYLLDKIGALQDKPRSGQPRKVTAEVEAAVTRIACSSAPDGRSRWTISLLKGKIIELGHQVGTESVRQILKKANSSPGSKSSGALAK